MGANAFRQRGRRRTENDSRNQQAHPPRRNNDTLEPARVLRCACRRSCGWETTAAKTLARHWLF